MFPWNSSAMGWKTSPPPTSPPFSIGTARNTIRALHKPPLHNPKEKRPMNTHSSITPISENPKQPQQRQTAKEMIAANVKCLIEQLEAGTSEALTAYLNAMSRFHNYSFGNVLEIARQRPNATRVAGMYAWNQLGRRVKKGERGIRILAP